MQLLPNTGLDCELNQITIGGLSCGIGYTELLEPKINTSNFRGLSMATGYLKLSGLAVGLALSILGLSGGAAQAAIVTFDLSGVTFSDGSTASGSFVFNSTADTISDINIVLTGGSLLPSLTLTGGGPTDVVALSGAVEFQILDPESSPFALNDLSLIVQTPVSLTSPNPIDVFSSPTSSGNPNNFTSTDSLFPDSLFGSSPIADVTAGDLNPQISGVPEISTWAMMLIGFGLVGFKLRRRGTVLAT